ncbi:MAG: glycosyltransferase family 4 protein [Thaumarchaeota archaeon]|nr:glycosyltransferase family 4 protein [Nitrososphaerota archaeon]
MKICAVSQSFYPYSGGVSYYLLWLGKKCRGLGHSLQVVHLRSADSPVEDVIEGIGVHRVPSQPLDPRVSMGYTTFKELILNVFHGEETSEEKLINKHLHGFHEYLTVSEQFARRVRQIYDSSPFDLLHVHDFQLLPLGYMLRDIPSPKIFTWHIPFTEDVPEAWLRFVIDYMKEYDNVVLSTNAYVATAIHHGLAWYKVTCINPFIAVDGPPSNDFRPRYGLKPDDRMILCVARIDPLKGQDALIKALPAVTKVIPNVRCVFIGDGSMTKEVLKASAKRVHEKNLRDLVEALKLEGRVIFTGHISRNDLMQAYETCDVVVLPSIMEGFGLTVSEGMAFGKPVVGSATGGIMMQILPGVNGYLVEPGNSQQLGEALTLILSDDKFRKTLGKKARQVFENQFSVERGVTDNLELYERVITSYKAQREWGQQFSTSPRLV